MSRQRESYKKMHPEQFSDSEVIQKGKLERPILDYYLESLTSRNMDKQFEDFCRHIAENEICPNLLPQTGPTGGGDSKVDSETYPVSEQLSEMWFYENENRLAAEERWAFAISAKRDWRSKIKSDVAKICKIEDEKHRGYKKIFFMSNQYIPDKKRADTEDELREKFGIDVRILDRTWLLDRVFASKENINVTVHSLELSDSFIDEVQTGRRDFERKNHLEEIEQRLKDTTIKCSEKVELVQNAVILGRELEVSKDREMGFIDRSIRISREYGNKVYLAKAYYDAAWTVYWWYTDIDQYYSYYIEYEKIVLEENNVNLFAKLVNLWTNLFTLSMENANKFQLNLHTEKITEKYLEYINDLSKPNTALEAKAAYFSVRLLSEEDINNIVADMMEIIDEGLNHIDLSLYSLQRIIQEFPPLEKADRYDELFEKVISAMSMQKQKTAAAIMLAKKGYSIKGKRPYEAMAYFSRTLLSFHNEEDKQYLISVVLEMAQIFENMGLYWASRNFYYFDFCLCLNQYLKFGTVSSALFLSADALKYVELRLGHVLYAIGFNILEKMALACYPKEVNVSEEQEDNFDYILAIQLLRTKHSEVDNLQQMPAYLDWLGLYFSEVSMKYLLGYYDEQILQSLDGNKDAFDDLMGKWKEQPALEEMRGNPWYGYESSCEMCSKVLGCVIKIRTNRDYEHGEIEVATTILATIESFLGTGIKNELISICGNIVIDVIYNQNEDFFIKGKLSSEQSNHILVTFSEYASEKIVDAQNEFAVFTTELISMIISLMFPYDGAFDKVKKMVQNDAALDRAYTFSNSIFFGMETLGKELFLFENVLSEFDKLRNCRTEPIFEDEIIECEEDKNDGIRIIYQSPPDELEFKNISNENIYTNSLINIPLWNCGKWMGVMYIADKYTHSTPPILSIMFENSSGRKIFEEWIQEIGHNDDKDKIGIRIIKGIDKKHPHWYRIVVGMNNPFSQGKCDKTIMMMPSRVHTMTPNDSKSLLLFEQELKKIGSYVICPCSMQDNSMEPKIYKELYIKKSGKSIVICDACDVPDNDVLFFSGILPDDTPVIPLGKENAPILHIIEARKKINARKK